MPEPSRDSTHLSSPPSPDKGSRTGALRRVLRGLTAHVLASYAAAPLLTIVLGWGPPCSPIAGVWGAYLLAPILVPYYLGWELVRFFCALGVLRWKWSWSEPATAVAVYCALFAVWLCLLRCVGGRIAAARSKQAQSCRAKAGPLPSALEEVAFATLVTVIVLAVIGLLLALSYMAGGL